ncbi:cytochrome P450 2J4-like [Amphibalanus amphitrite]|uniref:cytochrome P450 2J4-like n=1 Tax=Amphibalanus amphitrite TaxID=1232801 RepID=UPI001C92A77C|nr:cytochrome P450 2J4-like [Amphibalanus amphitrite]
MAVPLLPLLGLLLLAVLLVWGWRTTRRPAWAPHGPPLLPWVGSALSFDVGHGHWSYSRWAERYGGIYHVRLGPLHQVVLSRPDLIREAFGRSEVAGRPDTALSEFVVRRQGLAFSEGALWQYARRLTLHHLRNFGMGKSRIETYIHHQIKGYMDQFLTPNIGRAVEIDQTLNVAVVNILWKLMASEELDITDHKIQNMIQEMMEGVNYAAKLVILDVYPWLRAILPEFVFNRAKKEREFGETVRQAFTPALEEHRKELNVNGEPRDYMEAMLQEQHHHPESMTDWHLLMCLRGLFIAGNDTTANTLRWALGFLCQRPDVQRRLQGELDSEVGRQRPPTLADRQRLPFTEAVILETQRLANVAPVLVPHQTTAPVTVGGYHLPAGVQVIGNAYSVHCSAELFPEPFQFRPERFVDAQGQFKPDRNVMPFSVGKRQCLGEAMARAELFLFLTGLLQNFSFAWPEGETHDFLEDVKNPSFVLKPAPYKVVPSQR